MSPPGPRVVFDCNIYLQVLDPVTFLGVLGGRHG